MNVSLTMRITAAVAATLLGVVPSRGQTRVWTLDECISHALTHNIDIKRQELTLEEREISVSEAEWGFSPTVSASSGYNLATGRVLDETTYEYVENDTVGSSSSSVYGSMTIFNGFTRLRQLQRARLDQKSGFYDLETARNDVRASVTAYYMEVLSSREAVNEAEQIAELLESQCKNTEERLKAGRVTEADLLQIRAEFYSAMNDILTARNSYDMARLNLCQLIEIEDYTTFEVSEEETLMQAVPDSMVSSSEISLLIASRPEVMSAEIGVELARKDIQIARSSQWPSVSLSAGYGSGFSDARRKILLNDDGSYRYEAYPFFSQYMDNASSYVSLSLSIPIFSGMTVRNSIRRGKIALSEAEYALVAARKKVEKEYMQAYIDVRTAAERYRVSMEQAEYAEEAARQIGAKYEEGAADVLSYRAAISELATARYRMLSAKYEYIFKCRLLALYYR